MKEDRSYVLPIRILKISSLRAQRSSSAQRRRSNAILQHGSVLLKRSPRSPELSGAVDQTDLSAEPQFWSQLLVDKLPGALGLVGAAGVLPEAIQERRDALVQSVYRTNSWNRKR